MIHDVCFISATRRSTGRKIIPGEKVAFEPIIDVKVSCTPVTDDAPVREEVTVPLGLKRDLTKKSGDGRLPKDIAIECNDKYAFFSFNVTRSSSSGDDLLRFTFYTIGGDSNEIVLSLGKNCLETVSFSGAIDIIRKYDEPFATAGNVVYNMFANKVHYLNGPYWWTITDDGRSYYRMSDPSLLPLHQFDDYDASTIHVQTLLLARSRRKKLQRVPIAVSGKLGFYGDHVLASDVAFIDTEFRLIYVLIKDLCHTTYTCSRGNLGIRVVTLTYRPTLLSSESQQCETNQVALSWNMNADSGSSYLSVTCFDVEKKHVFQANVMGYELLGNCDPEYVFGGDAVMTQKIMSDGWVHNHLGVKDVLLYGAYSNPDTEEQENDMTAYTQPFLSTLELRESTETYFKMLHMHSNFADDYDDGADFIKVRNKFWFDRLRYGPFILWNLAHLIDLSSTFKDVAFPYIVSELHLRQWQLSKHLTSVQEMFKNVRNVNRIVLPDICFVPKDDEEANFDAVAMFENASINEAVVQFYFGEQVTSLVATGMFNDCQFLEMVYLSACSAAGIQVNMPRFASNCPVLQVAHIDILDGYNITYASHAFANCTHLEHVNIPFPVMSPDDDDASSYGDYTSMFENCPKLHWSNIPELFDQLRLLVTDKSTKVHGMFYKSLVPPDKGDDDDAVTTLHLPSNSAMTTQDVQAMLALMAASPAKSKTHCSCSCKEVEKIIQAMNFVILQ